jgi:hypothetical protein
LQSVEAQSREELDRGFARILSQHPDAVIVFTESLTLAFRKNISC